MANPNPPLTLEERFQKHARSKGEASRVYSRIKDCDFMNMTLNDLLSIPNIGKKAMMLIVEVAAELKESN